MKRKTNKKTKQAGFHFHSCGDHSWRHNVPKSRCNLSKHAVCGFSIANDYAHCVKGKTVYLHPEKTAETVKAARLAKTISQREYLSEMQYNFQTNREEAMIQLRAARKAARLAAKPVKKVKKNLTRSKKRAKVKLTRKSKLKKTSKK